jgi:hypothetical protein
MSFLGFHLLFENLHELQDFLQIAWQANGLVEVDWKVHSAPLV